MKNELADRIRESFPDVPVPGADEIVVDSGHLHLEKEAVHRFLSGKKWTYLTHDRLEKNYKGDGSAILSFVSDVGFKYYYPAFLMLTLKRFRESGYVFVYSSFYSFMPKNDHQLDRLVTRRLNQFSVKQLKVILAVFDFVKDEEADIVAANEIEAASKNVRNEISLRIPFSQ